MIHGLAASLHDWDFLIPELEREGYAGYALDLLGHGESPKPAARLYQMDWLFDHFLRWVDSLQLDQPLVLVGHSLGGYFAIEFAHRYPERTRGLILVDPFFSRDQLPVLLRWMYHYPRLIGNVIQATPAWMLRLAIHLTSISIGHGVGGLHGLPPELREQSLLDYSRTAPGVYNIPNTGPDLTPLFSMITRPSLVVWGDQDRTLAPSSFVNLVKRLPNAQGEHIRASHIPHQTHVSWFNRVVLDFLKTI